MFFIGHNYWREKVQTLDKDETFSVHVSSTCVHMQNRSILLALVNCQSSCVSYDIQILDHTASQNKPSLKLKFMVESTHTFELA